MIRPLATIAAIAMIGGVASAASLDVPSGTYQLDRTHASVVWKVDHLGLSNYTGRFATLDATIELDAENVANSKVTATVEPGSINTLYPFPEQENFDAKLGNEWLKSAEFPLATFTSTEIEVTGDNTALVKGNLEMLGQSHPLEFNVTLNGAKQHPMAGKAALGISATGTLDRTQYGVEQLAGPVGAEVTLIIEAEFLAE